MQEQSQGICTFTSVRSDSSFSCCIGDLASGQSSTDRCCVHRYIRQPVQRSGGQVIPGRLVDYVELWRVKGQHSEKSSSKVSHILMCVIVCGLDSPWLMLHFHSNVVVAGGMSRCVIAVSPERFDSCLAEYGLWGVRIRLSSSNVKCWTSKTNGPDWHSVSVWFCTAMRKTICEGRRSNAKEVIYPGLKVFGI